MNETTKSDIIMIMHRLKRLIGSFYHQKRIDIIITDNAHYIQSDGTWKQKNVVTHPYATVEFIRSDGQLQVNNGMTLMRMTLTHNEFNWLHPIEFVHDAESNSDEHEDMDFHKQ